MQSKIEFKTVSFVYPNQVKALNQLSFKIEAGKKIALIGKNGSGKSTIAKLIDGLLSATSGKILIDEIELNETTIADLRQKIGIVFQNPEDQIIGATVEEDVAFGLENRNLQFKLMKKRVNQALQDVGMSEYANINPNLLSGGQKQKVSLARSLALQPSILILDEATSMLDPIAKSEIKHIISSLQRKNKLTVIYITHDMEMLENVDQVLALDHGDLVFNGKPEKLYHETDILAQLAIKPPFTEQIKQLFKEHGYNPPVEYLDDRGLSEWITKLF
ncbi:energy-coupling factor transporter ATPase [Fructilactobacillus sanfranciscensis]|uniref:energy-coupling factor transporter ATPase n=1 Tax=Fructilactobacillus sanfranciscensis TaxID=1625 RepID=UPI00111B46E2|nr:energy-coupling factor transporter ATPase [Fructilactobacillus sanfranciscensis]MVF15699.1 energy-coupling factor transporter ATPase [Fructilactobacillus sanfranciscensis]TNK99551.1 energy-coupling factor transporter ATPase [Fructilactobacillus sanfranciscensis]